LREVQHLAPLHFGLGSYAGPVTVEVRWPSGIGQTLPETVVDRILEVLEPAMLYFPVIAFKPAKR
jgi:hypothetical protein